MIGQATLKSKTAPVAVAALCRANRPMRPPETIVVSEIADSLEPAQS